MWFRNWYTTCMFIPPPLVLLIAIVLSFLASRLTPSLTIALGSLQWLGAILAFFGIALVAWSFRFFEKHKTAIHPRGKPRSLITEGPYARTRNPIYLGFLCISLGIALLFANVLALVGPLLFFSFISMFIIPFEEEILIKTFGDNYSKYRAHTRRWV